MYLVNLCKIWSHHDAHLRKDPWTRRCSPRTDPERRTDQCRPWVTKFSDFVTRIYTNSTRSKTWSLVVTLPRDIGLRSDAKCIRSIRRSDIDTRHIWPRGTPFCPCKPNRIMHVINRDHWRSKSQSRNLLKIFHLQCFFFWVMISPSVLFIRK